MVPNVDDRLDIKFLTRSELAEWHEEHGRADEAETFRERDDEPGAVAVLVGHNGAEYLTLLDGYEQIVIADGVIEQSYEVTDFGVYIRLYTEPNAEEPAVVLKVNMSGRIKHGTRTVQYGG